jgi:hypothetical protein
MNPTKSLPTMTQKTRLSHTSGVRVAQSLVFRVMVGRLLMGFVSMTQKTKD